MIKKNFQKGEKLAGPFLINNYNIAIFKQYMKKRIQSYSLWYYYFQSYSLQ